MHSNEYHRIAEKYLDDVYRTVLGCCGNKENAEDAVQNAFLKLMRETNTIFKDDEHIKRWLIKVALNECKNWGGINMNMQDKEIGRMYKEIYENVHASEDFKEKVINMNNKKSNKAKVIKTICALAAAAVAIAAGTMAVSASRAEFDTVIVNGKEEKARFIDFGTGTRMWEYINDDTSYSIYVHGDFDMDKDTLYILDNGDYFLASTEPEPTLNLYDKIDESPFAEFKEKDGQKFLCIKDNEFTTDERLFEDEKDGKADGLLENHGFEAYTLLPNGAVVNTMKTENIGFLKNFGYDSDKFWNNIYSNLDSNK